MTSRQMIHFKMGERVFNHRVAGIAVRAGHVLVCREDADDYALLPGGRIEFGEDSHTSLIRELAEELQSPAEAGRLLFTVENFFIRQESLFHEVGMYFEIMLPTDFPFAPGETVLETEDEGHRLYFSWVPIEQSALKAANLLPLWLHERLDALPQEPQHLIIDERQEN